MNCAMEKIHTGARPLTERSRDHENEAKYLYEQITALKRRGSDQRVLRGKNQKLSNESRH